MAIKFTGEYRIPAPRDSVWMALNDTEILKASIDQVEELEWTGASALRTTIAARIGPMKARFRGGIELTEIDAPHAYTLIGQGDGGVAGFAKATARVRLMEDGEHTRFVYDCDAEIGGRLGTIGGKLVRGAADRAADAFFEKFASRLVVAISAREAAADVEPWSGGTSDGGAGGGGGFPFSWEGAAAGLADRLKALETEQGAAGLATAGGSAWDDPPSAPGMIPVGIGTLLIAGGWVAMVGILLLLFAT